MSRITYFSPNIHQNGPKILEVKVHHNLKVLYLPYY
jgi:hypothetical protein